MRLALLLLCACSSSTPDGDVDGCKPGDADGLIGGSYTFELNVSDDAFTPSILKSQNLGHVRLTLHNTGTKPHSFSVGCIDTSRLNGCPAQTCFPAASGISNLAAGASATVEFDVPNPEGIYEFKSDGDAFTGQFIVQ